MDELYLVTPEYYHEEPVLDFRRECLEAGETRINGSCGLHHYEKYEDWMGNVARNRNTDITENTTRADSFLAFRAEDDRLVGTIQLRHTIPKPLSVIGGHIGYEIRPSERRKGYAKTMLRETLKLAKAMGLSKVRIDCDKDNPASRNTILACGGVLQRELLVTVRQSGTTVALISSAGSERFVEGERLLTETALSDKSLPDGASRVDESDEPVLHRELVQHFVIDLM